MFEPLLNEDPKMLIKRYKVSDQSVVKSVGYTFLGKLVAKHVVNRILSFLTPN